MKVLCAASPSLAADHERAARILVLALSPDGQRIYARGHDGAVWSWILRDDEVHAAAKAKACNWWMPCSPQLQVSLALTEIHRVRPADPDLRTPAQPLLSVSPDGRFVFCTGATACDIEQRDAPTGQVRMCAGCCVLALISADRACVHLPGCARAAPDTSQLLEHAPERSGRFARLASGLRCRPEHRRGV